MLDAHALTTLILTHLNTHLAFSEGTLTPLYCQTAVSGDHIRFIKAPPQPRDDLRIALGQHTDFGPITILFNRVGGLQVLLPHSNEWRYVKPLPGHCIVNLGDAMVKFTNGLLRSNLHSVVAPPGEQVGWTRDAVVYSRAPGVRGAVEAIGGSRGVIAPLAEWWW